MKKIFMLLVVVSLLCSCATTDNLKFIPVNVTSGNTQAQDEAGCRNELQQYRTGINSNWFSNQVYKDCMIMKGYVQGK